MRLAEIISEQQSDSSNKILSLLVFLQSRAEQTGAKPQISMSALSQMAHGVGVSLTYDSFSNLMQSNPSFKSLVSDFNAEEVVLNLAGDEQTIASKADLDLEPVDKVDSMAKRALKKRT
ncbi:MAG: hypothetical protein ACKVJK_16245 [Methylophagaceae bacterium]|tara:strand:+ start:951 stop:1307 length:357 start_codon:yes stop_codon:yes gene_type:complete